MAARLITLPRSAPDAPAERIGVEAAELIRKLSAALRGDSQGDRNMTTMIDARTVPSHFSGDGADGRPAPDAVLASAQDPSRDELTYPIEEAVLRDAARARDALRRRLRANAHAAYHTVQGSQEAAVDAALAVIEAELLSIRAEREAYAEALKVIRLYARDGEIRALAGQTLGEEGRPPSCLVGGEVLSRAQRSNTPLHG